MYTEDEEAWFTMAKMSKARGYHACGLATNKDGKQEVIIAGGDTSTGRTDSVEVYSIEDNRWMAGNSLPVALYYMASVPFRNSFLVVGGYSSTEGFSSRIYMYNGEDGTWTKQPISLQKARYQHTAILVSSDTFPNFH